MNTDRFGRRINYLRLSLTDRCNFRCAYCMPEADLDFFPNEKMLSPADYELVVRAAVRTGFSKFRLTGGEPTLRKDLIEIVERVARAKGSGRLAMTTNAVLLDRMAADLSRAGLERINVHLDTLNDANLGRIMRRAELDSVWAGIEAAERAGLTPIKINAVVTRDYTDDDVVELASLTLTRDWHVRFIELMPLGEGPCAHLARDHFVSNVRTRARIEYELGELESLSGDDPADESANFRASHSRGVIGFISPVSAPYCGACNRMRLTPDGKLHLCLLNDDELDVLEPIRSGDQTEIERLLGKAIALKPTGHALKEQMAGVLAAAGAAPRVPDELHSITVGPSTRDREMYQIGG